MSLNFIAKPVAALGLLAAVSVTPTMLTPTAQALSCMRPDLARTMETAKASDDLYYIVVGTFDYAPIPRAPKSDDPNAPLNGIGPHTIKARFNGRIMSNIAAGDQRVTQLPVDIDVSCGGPWCGSAPGTNQDVIAFVQVRDNQPLLLRVGPCPDKVFRLDPAHSQLQTLRDCFDKACKSDGIFDRY